MSAVAQHVGRNVGDRANRSTDHLLARDEFDFCQRQLLHDGLKLHKPEIIALLRGEAQPISSPHTFDDFPSLIPSVERNRGQYRLA
jgi:hypothetical protein